MGLKAIEIVESKRKRRRKVWISAISSFLVLAFVFVLFTSQGQAFAKTVFSTVANWFDGSLVVEYSDQGNQITEKDLEIGTSVTVSTVHEAAAYLREGLIYVDNDKVSLEEISIDRVEGITILLSKYQLGEGSFFLQQQVYDDETLMSSFVPSEEETYTQIELFNGNIIYSTITPEGNYLGIAIWKGTQIQVMSDSVASQDLEECIKGFKAI